MLKADPGYLARLYRSEDLAAGVVLKSAPEIENQVTSVISSECDACEIEYDPEYAQKVADEYYKLAQEDEDGN